MTRRLRRALIGTLLAAAVAAPLGVSITASHADHISYWSCQGGSWQSVCARLAENAYHTKIRAVGKGGHLSTRFTYKLTARLEKCFNDGSGCTTVRGPVTKWASGVTSFQTTTSYYDKPGGSWCYKSKANLYRKRADGSYDWLVGSTQSWC